MVLTADSAFPLALLFPGLMVLCSKSQSFANFWNSTEVNCELLSLMRRSGQL